MVLRGFGRKFYGLDVSVFGFFVFVFRRIREAYTIFSGRSVFSFGFWRLWV